MCSAGGDFSPSPKMKIVNFYSESGLQNIGSPVRNNKSPNVLTHGQNMEHFKIDFCLSTLSKPIYNAILRETENLLEFAQVVSFELMDSLNNKELKTC